MTATTAAATTAMIAATTATAGAHARQNRSHRHKKLTLMKIFNYLASCRRRWSGCC